MNEQLPIIDWEQHTQVGSLDNAMSKELLTLFIEQLPELEKHLAQAYTKQDLIDLQSILHKLQGACAYCGLPRLRNLIMQINREAKQTNHLASQHYEQLLQEISVVKNELNKIGIK